LWVDAAGTQVMANATPVIEALNWQSRFFADYEPGELDQFALSVNKFMNSGHPVFGGARLSCQQCHRDQPMNENKIPDHSFYDGKVAMMVDGQWQVGSAYVPHFKPDLNYGVAAFPSPADHPEQSRTTLVQGPVVVIPSNAIDRDAAMELLAWMMSPEIVTEISLATAMLPTSQTAAADPRFHKMTHFDLFMDLLLGTQAEFIPAASFSTELNQALQAVEKATLHQDRQSPEIGLDEVQAQFSP
jgi:ABC-type glycerol-3-phosphate transport system substrate-binding protein